jgi:hypothetical protein
VTTKPRVAIVIGSTRPGRYADIASRTNVRDDRETPLMWDWMAADID